MTTMIAMKTVKRIRLKMKRMGKGTVRRKRNQSLNHSTWNRLRRS